MRLPVLLAVLAVVLGTSVEMLVWARTPGVNWMLLVACALGVNALLLSRLERRVSGWVMGLWGMALTVSGGVTLHDAAVVQVAGPAMCALLLVLAWGWTFVHACPIEVLAMPVRASWIAALGYVWPGMRDLRDPQAGPPIPRPVLHGLLLALPLLVVFGALFCASDPMFAHLVRGLEYQVSGETLLIVVRLLVFSCLALGLLRYAALHEGDRGGLPWKGMQADAVTLSTALLLVDVLFAAFLVVQARYLFGGAPVLAVPGLTYAEYARRGFFELVTATAVVFFVGVCVHAATCKLKDVGWVNALLALLVVETFGVAASAVKRLALYADVYGLTVARFYASGAMLIICAVLGLVLYATLRRRTLDWMLSRVFYAVLLLLSMLSLPDVESLVARTNLAREGAVDVAYLSSLSADVVPVLVEAAGAADPRVRAAARQALQLRVPVEPDDRVSYNVSRARARSLLGDP